MAQEDDLRALGKIMDFMRGISVIFLLANCYWFCYEAFQEWHFTLGIINKILMNFERTTGLFSSILWTKLFCVVFLTLSCLGTKGVKEEKSTVQIFAHVIFSSFTPFVPRQDKARKTTQKSFVQRIDENNPVVRWKFISILSMIPSVKPQT